MRLLVIAPLLAVAAGCSSGNSNCVTTASLAIQVVDDEAQVSLCNATVTITPAGGQPTTIHATAPKPPCSYQTDPLGAGLYDIAVMDTGYQSQTSSTRLNTIECSVQAPNLTFSLTPAH